VRFVYTPTSVRVGALLSGAGLCVLAWLALVRRSSLAPG
jgi:hypothetical protein